MNASATNSKDGIATAGGMKNTLLEPSFLATLKDFKVSREQLRIVEPVYQKVSSILNLDAATQKRGFIVLYKILSMNITALPDSFIHDQMERLKQKQGENCDNGHGYTRKYRKNIRASSLSLATTSTTLSSSTLQKSMYVDGRADPSENGRETPPLRA